VVLSDLAALQERIKLLQEEIAARVNEDNARSLYLLTIVTVMALPINLIAGLLGMNVGGVPLAEDGHGFWIALGLSPPSPRWPPGCCCACSASAEPARLGPMAPPS
jgi:zinc transporter